MCSRAILWCIGIAVIFHMDISMLSSFRCVSIGSDRADISHLTLDLAQFMRLSAKYDSNNNTG